MKFARVCLSGSWLAFGRRTLGATEMLLPVFPSHAHLQESRRPCRIWVEDQPTRGRFLFSYKCGKEWCSQRITLSTDKWKSTAKNQDNVIWIVSLGLREYKKLRRICSELLPMVRQLVQEVNWHEATIEDKGPSIDDILSFHPVALKWDKQGVCIFCYEPGAQKKLQVANVTPDVNEGTLEFVWNVKGGLRTQERRQVVEDLSQAIGLMKKIRNKSFDKPIGEGLLWKSVTQLQVDLPPQRHPHVGNILEQLLPSEGLERNLEGLSKMLATMKGGSFPIEGDTESNLVPTTVWLDHGVLKPLVYQMADYQRASDERIYSRALQALLRLLKVGGSTASSEFIKAVVLAISGEGLTHIGVYRILAAVLHRPEVKQAAMDLNMPNVLLTELQRYCVLMISRKASNPNGMITTRSGRYSARTTATGGLAGSPPPGPLPPHLLPNEGQYSLMERIWGVQPHMSTDQNLLHLHSSVLEILLALSPLEVPEAEPASDDFKCTLVKHLLLLGPSKYSFKWQQSVRTYDLAIACVHEYACGAPRGVSFGDEQGFRLFLPRAKTEMDEPAEQDLLVGYIVPEILELVEMRTLDVTVQRGLYERLRLIVDYVWSSPSPILAQQLLDTLTQPLVELCSMILKGALARNGDWPITLLQLFYLILSLFTALSERVADKHAQDELLRAISSAEDFMELLWHYAYHTLTCDRAREVLGDCEVETMCLGVWRFLTSVAELCKDQGTDDDADSVVNTLSGQLAFPLEPESGLVVRILGMVHWVDEDEFRDDLCVQVLAFLEAFFSIPNSLITEAPDLITQELELNFRAFQGHSASSAGDFRCTQCRVCAASLAVIQSILAMQLEAVYLYAMHLRMGEHLVQEIVPQGSDDAPTVCLKDGCLPFLPKGNGRGLRGGVASTSCDSGRPLSSHPVFEVEELSSTSEEEASMRGDECSEASWASPALGGVAPRSCSPSGSGWVYSRPTTTTTSSVMSLDSVEFEGRCMEAPRPPGVPKLDLSNVANGSDGYYTPLSEDDYESTILEEDDPVARNAALACASAAAERVAEGASESGSEDRELALVPQPMDGPCGPGQQVGDSPLRPVSQLESDAPPLALMPIPECRQMVDWDKFDGLTSGRPPSNFEFTGDCSEDARRWEEWEPRSEQTSSEYDLTEYSEVASTSSAPNPGGTGHLEKKKRPVVPPVALDVVCRSQEVVHHVKAPGPGPGPSGSQKGKIIWKHKDLHAGVLRVLLELVLLEFETVGRRHGGESVLVRRLCVALHQHLNKLHNKGLLLELRDWAVLRGPSHIRLVRLVMKELFDERSYESLGRIGRGQFAQVHRCSQPLEGGPATCAVKVVDVPEDAQAMRSLRDIYREIEVLECLSEHPCVSELYDYGVVEDTVFVVMKEYKCDLLTWRRRMSSPPPPKLCLKIFLHVAEAVQKVHQSGVAHFDLKCSNVFLEALPGLSEDRFWSPQMDDPAFRVVLGDFGEAMRIGDDHETTLRSRGTEWMKSPEMLLVGKGTHGGESVAPPTFPSDVWALGCLLFELQSGKPLFDDSDWGEFFVRITDSSMPLIPTEKLGMLPRTSQRIVATLLSFVLIRDPRLRPPLVAVIAWVQNMLAGHAPPSAPARHAPRSLPPSPSPPTPASGSTTSATLATCRRGSRNAFTFVPLTETVLLCSRRALEDPWTLLQKRVSHILYINSGGGPEELAVVRGVACRADVPLVTVDKLVAGEEAWARLVGSVLRMVKRGRRLAVVSGEGGGWGAGMERVGVTLLSEELGWPRMKCRLNVRAVMVQ